MRHVFKSLAATFERLHRPCPASPLPAGDTWAKQRLLLQNEPTSKASLELVESSICALSFERATPSSKQEVAKLCHGGTCRNLWFDKAVTMVVFENGRVGINAEHTPVDAMTVVSLIINALDEMKATIGDRAKRAALLDAPPPSLTGVKPPQLLHWVLPPPCRAALEAASTAVVALATVDTSDEEAFMEAVYEVFYAFDQDASGELGLDEMRELVTMLHPSATPNCIRESMLEVRKYGDPNGELAMDNFVDALHAVNDYMRGALGAEAYESERQMAAEGISHRLAVMREKQAKRNKAKKNAKRNNLSRQLSKEMLGGLQKSISGMSRGSSGGASSSSFSYGAMRFYSSSCTPRFCAPPSDGCERQSRKNGG